MFHFTVIRTSDFPLTNTIHKTTPDWHNFNHTDTPNYTDTNGPRVESNSLPSVSRVDGWPVFRDVRDNRLLCEKTLSIGDNDLLQPLYKHPTNFRNIYIKRKYSAYIVAKIQRIVFRKNIESLRIFKYTFTKKNNFTNQYASILKVDVEF